MADEENGAVKESKFDFKIIIIGVVIFLIALGASYFVLRSVFSPLMPKEATKGDAKSTNHGALFDVGEFTTNIEDSTGSRYMKLKVSLELNPDDKKAAEECATYKPIIRDGILGLISSKTVADFDPRNRENVKQEILKALNSKLGSNMITNVYFEDIIIQ
ncbi:MAG TPA: flagellar basal body-associated FliL family protein [Syntrophomonadaceae bacterium]|nr:flagellar basal body-associated FliL family protein [Syntrophomonadaceae bacterium]